MQQIVIARWMGVLLCVTGGCAGKVIPGTEIAPITAADGGTGVAPGDGSVDDVEGSAASDAGRSSLDATTGSAGATRDGGGSSANANGDLVPLFVAVGQMGRTTVSCDDGQSWVAHRAKEEAPCDADRCDHSDTANSGLAYAADGHRFFSTRGWGYDGPIEYTDDGQSWTTVPQTGRWGGITAGAGAVFVMGSPTLTSNDLGRSWQSQPELGLNGHVRGTVFFADDKFWVMSDQGDVRISTDGTRSWHPPKAKDSRCARDFAMHQGGLAYGNGVVVIVNQLNGVVCRSTDHGDTFVYVTAFNDDPSSPLVFADGQFWQWSNSVLHRSRDGSSWESTPITNMSRIGPVARSSEGTWVAADGAYGDEKIARSKDGIHWDVLPQSRYTPSHRLRMISFGLGKKPSACK